MATWAIGDVHGCFRTLEALIDRIDLDQRRDRLWMVGDLVNRGPLSLQALRWARALDDEMSDRFQVVLGNHDLHLIARGLGIAAARPRDTLDQVLMAPDRAELIEWLRRRPFVYSGQIESSQFALVHAGLPTGWSPKDVHEAGKRLERQLQSSEVSSLLGHDRSGRDESGGAAPQSRNRAALTAFTRMRMLDSNARPHDYSGPPQEAPAGLRPWFEVEPRACPAQTVVCGHWAALGYRQAKDLIALDTGCVWSGKLTAVRLEDRRAVQEKMSDRLTQAVSNQLPSEALGIPPGPTALRF